MAKPGTPEAIKKSREAATKVSQQSASFLPGGVNAPGAGVKSDQIQVGGTPEGAAGLERVLNSASPEAANAVSNPNQQADSIAEAVQRDAEAGFEALGTTDIDYRQSTKILQDLASKLSQEQAPEAPSLAGQFSQLRSSFGINALETELAQIDKQIQQLDVQEIGFASSGQDLPIGVGGAVLRGDLSKKQREAQIQKALLQVERTAVATIAQNKLSALEMSMQFTQQDFMNASRAYEQNFNRNLTMIDLFSQFEAREERIEDRAIAAEQRQFEREVTEEEREFRAEDRQTQANERLKKDAQANLQTITNMLQQSGKTFAELTEDQKRQVNQWELEAGLPVGITEELDLKAPQDEILHLGSRTDAQGNQYFDVLRQTPDGEMYVDKMFRGSGEGTGAGTGSGLFGTDTQKEREILLKLRGVGFTEEDMTLIDQDVAEFGLDEVLKNDSITDPQKKVLRELYGQEEDQTKLTRENISSLFGIPDDDEKTGFLGFGKTNKEKLNEIMESIEKYQAVGYSDEEILKLMREE